MGWHVHFKDGKFNIWSTVVDEYILPDWVKEEDIITMYKVTAVEKAEEDAKGLIIHARENKGCSIPYSMYRCRAEDI